VRRQGDDEDGGFAGAAMVNETFGGVFRIEPFMPSPAHARVACIALCHVVTGPGQVRPEDFIRVVKQVHLRVAVKHVHLRAVFRRVRKGALDRVY